MWITLKHGHAEQVEFFEIALVAACNNADAACFSVEANDKLGLEAIMALHHQLDDDRNGNIDISETDDVSH